jgi:hypothetical protein
LISANAQKATPFWALQIVRAFNLSRKNVHDHLAKLDIEDATKFRIL